jgi:trk system potassium uptake protein TrkH
MPRAFAEIWPLPAAWRPVVSRLRLLTVLVAGFASALSLLVLHGLRPGHGYEPLATVGLAIAAGALVLETLLSAWEGPRLRDLTRRRPIALALLALFLLQLLLLRFGGDQREGWLQRLALGDLTHAYLLSLQLYVLATLLAKFAQVHGRLSRIRMAPGRLLFLLFVSLAALGMLLLKLPGMLASGSQLRWIDALFTATSAVCVTGLSVISIDGALSDSGQVLLAGLIQVGGMGIMAVTGFLAIAAGSGLGIRDRAFLADVLHADVVSEVVSHLRLIFWFTLIVEAVGALLLVDVFRSAVPGQNPVRLAIFHSISAFCNAGFSTLPDNLASLMDQARGLWIFMLLIALGGIGFGNLLMSWAWLRRRLRGQHVPPPLGLRLVWISSVILWSTGFVFFFLVERGNSMAGMPWHRGMLHALFLSVTARTAGFNTVEVVNFAQPTLLLLMLFMFIGGASGSTAGGVKLGTIAVMVAVVRSLFRGREDVSILGRRIAPGSVREAIAVVFVGGLVVFAGLSALLLWEDLPFLSVAFEAVSALGTVGLSMGVTASLGDGAKLTLIVLMLLGRVGPLSLVLALGRSRKATLQLPHERVTVG